MTVIYRMFCRIQLTPLYIHTVLHITMTIHFTLWFCKQIVCYNDTACKQTGLLYKCSSFHFNVYFFVIRFEPRRHEGTRESRSLVYLGVVVTLWFFFAE